MDICMDKEPDGVVVYTNGDSSNPKQENVPDQPPLVLVSPEDTTANTEQNTEVKEYEVKECTSETPIGKPKGDDSESKSVTKSKHASRSSRGSNITRNTIPKPFSLATEKRASTRLNQATKVAGKPLQPEKKKLFDDQDSFFVASATSGAKSTKSRTVVTLAPSFRSTERAEKRKEFYTKLEEKHQAKEAEKTKCEARNKEEKDAALRQLRKSLMFKANPLPKFYKEGPPPKVELKKLPTTRAKSPKLGRRKPKDGNRAKELQDGMKLEIL